ncbi:Biopolymer transport protein ExbD/TolR [Lentisphaera araneosa HTCC2155]|uniref:Biopolymer transport protein ExbD/TolR n=1 Tax=Lentisphaera araneosa HTCC2155 TaxID=313628 RepID=A6DH80_9BACT|nr:biopolymer transporter ExbD [Lentisphaera araneosa]EDM28963.1 Biopolymer transport protein ExbD/TolR [Lentisphaera araneosa HTCC2155]
MARRHRENAVLSNIDVTPLVDITFILLITFMVTMPAMENRIKLPQMTDQAPPQPELETTVWYNADGEVVIEGNKLTIDELENYILNMDTTNKVFTVKADEGRPYGEVISVLRAIKKAGISDVSLGTSSEN